MSNSIQQFQTEGVKKLEKILCDYAGDLTKVTEMIHGVTESGRGIKELYTGTLACHHEQCTQP